MPPKKTIVLYPYTNADHQQYNRASDVLSMSNLDAMDSIHTLQVDCHRPFHDSDHGPIMTEIDHDLMLSPIHSVAKTTTTTTSTQKQKYRVLGTFSLVGIIFFATCGGPVGSEPLISAGGPLIGLVAVMAYAVFCQLPLALMVTELCCAFPENGGYSMWAMTAFGPFWGFQSGYWSWIASVLNNAIYPGFIYESIASACGMEATSGAVAFVAKVAIAVALAVPSFIGVRFVGRGAMVFLVLVTLATLLFTTWGFVDGENAWFRLADVRGSGASASASGSGVEGDEEGVDWSLLVHALFWSFDGLFELSVIGGEVINPARTYPRVVVAVFALTLCMYTLPWISSISADKFPWKEYTEDSFSDIAEAMGGSFLHSVALLTSIVSSMGMFSCTLFFQSFLVQGMAQARLLPRKLRQRNKKFKTPQFAILFSLLATLALLGFDFEAILSMTNAFSGSLQVLMVLSMIQLRRNFPYLPRPVKMPGTHIAVVILMLLAPMCVFLFAIVTTFAEWKLGLVVVALAVPGFLFPVVQRRLSGRGWCS